MRFDRRDSSGAVKTNRIFPMLRSIRNMSEESATTVEDGSTSLRRWSIVSSISSEVIVLAWAAASKTSGARAWISSTKASYEGDQGMVERVRWSYPPGPGGGPSR